MKITLLESINQVRIGDRFYSRSPYGDKNAQENIGVVTNVNEGNYRGFVRVSIPGDAGHDERSNIPEGEIKGLLFFRGNGRKLEILAGKTMYKELTREA
jgi:hypothetical protein